MTPSPAYSCQPLFWRSITHELPSQDMAEAGDRVLVFTEGFDFAGEQFFEVKASALLDVGEDASEVVQHASHWAPLLTPAVDSLESLRKAWLFYEQAKQVPEDGTGHKRDALDWLEREVSRLLAGAQPTNDAE